VARQKTSDFEDLIKISSRLPWWGGASLALISYLCLHAYASRPPIRITNPGEMGPAVANMMYTSLAQFGQYILPLAFGMGSLVSAFYAWKQKKLYNRVAAGPARESLATMNWSNFERLISEFYQRRGYSVSRVGGNGPDGGVDLQMRKEGGIYLVQCKHWKTYKVGVQQVREFYGVMASRGVAGGYFVTSGQYTNDAIRFAAGTNLELVDGTKLQRMIHAAQQPVPAKPTAPSDAVVPNVRPAPSEEILPSTAGPVSAPPLCPLCDAPMSKRAARKGSKAGNEFWGCTAFPRCKGTRANEESKDKDFATIPDASLAAPVEEHQNCPHCGTALILRKFMSGPREGQEFKACLPCKKGWSIGAA
jgi:restriction system protein